MKIGTPLRSDRAVLTLNTGETYALLGDALTLLVDDQRRGETPEAPNRAARLFTQRGGVLVRLRDEGRGEVEVLNFQRLRVELAHAIEFRSPGRNGQYETVDPPASLVHAILAADRFPGLPELPELRRISTVPYYTRDGELVTQNGYHAASRTYLRMPATLQTSVRVRGRVEFRGNVELRGSLVIPHRPTYKDVEQAKRLLVGETFADFPFTAPSSLAHTLAVLLTPFVRELIGPHPVPGVAIVAPTVGSGKTLIAHVVSTIVTGDDAPVMAAELNREEIEKRITPLLLAGAPLGVFDNAIEKIDSPAMAALLTSTTWSGRVLGESRMVKLPNMTQWLLTGNNLEFTQEMARRYLSIALDPKTDSPNLRTGFKHDPLVAWVRAQRPALVGAVLTLVQHWLEQGRPEFTARTLGSYEAYVRVVGGILQAAGLDEGFLTTTPTDRVFSVPAKDADEDLVKMVKDWERTYGYIVVDARTLQEVAPPHVIAGKADSRVAVGRFVQMHQGRVITGHRIENVKVKDEAGRQKNAWRLVDVVREAREA